MDCQDQLIQHAENVTAIADSMGTPLLVIGAAALAGHHYVRLTRNLDLAGNVSIDRLKALADTLEREGYDVELRLPDAEDPLGGVLDLRGAFGEIQVISFADRFPAVIRDALGEASLRVRENSPLKVIPLPHLVVLKLYAGGLKSKADVVEVLSRNPEEDLDAIDQLCKQYGVRGFDEIRSELGGE